MCRAGPSDGPVASIHGLTTIVRTSEEEPARDKGLSFVVQVGAAMLMRH